MPDANYNGPDSFTFKVNDTIVDSNTATVTIDVTAVNDPPVANDDPGLACGSRAFGGSFPIPEDWSGGDIGFEGWFAWPATARRWPTTPILTVDPGFEVVGPPRHGAVASFDDGFLAFDPEPDYSTRRGDQAGGTWASDTISYRVFDGEVYSNTARYRLWIAPVNDAPKLQGRRRRDRRRGLRPLQGCVGDLRSAPARVSRTRRSTSSSNAWTIRRCSRSSPTISSDGVLTFTPAAGKYGLSTVTVRAHDDGGLESYPGVVVAPEDTSASQTFTIAVNPVNDAPVANDQSITAAEDIAAPITLSGSRCRGIGPCLLGDHGPGQRLAQRHGRLPDLHPEPRTSTDPTRSPSTGQRRPARLGHRHRLDHRQPVNDAPVASAVDRSQSKARTPPAAITARGRPTPTATLLTYRSR